MKSAIILCLTLSMVPASFAQPGDIGPPPGKLVDVGGRKLHLLCTGAGAPTVVLEAGASAFAIDWSLVQPEIARTNRVCSYDRAGYGWSDPGGSGDPGVAADLHSLLQVNGEHPPYVLVGASKGGLYVRLYHLQYPDEVAGMVLVDPAYEERLFTMFEGKPVTIASLTAEQLRSTIPQRAVKVPRRPPQTGAPFDRLPPALYEIRIELERRLIDAVPESVPYDAVVRSAEQERVTLAKLREMSMAQEHPIGDRPLIVLTRGMDSSQELKDAHARLARISTDSRHMVVANAGHEIHLFEPVAVIQAIQDVIAAAKNKTRLPAR
ncbi:MAG TPA: alpha/beta hydrolase [Acidobacteriota bacterium]